MLITPGSIHNAIERIKRALDVPMFDAFEHRGDTVLLLRDGDVVGAMHPDSWKEMMERAEAIQ